MIVGPAALGLVVNPAAGLGGPLGEKGSDDPHLATRPEARALAGRSAARAIRAVRAFRRISGAPIVTGPGVLGGALVPGAEIVADTRPDGSARDTRRVVEAMAGRVGLILFAGGDGTARDVTAANHLGLPILGIPAGVKMHSGVFARSPERAGHAAAGWLADPAQPVTMVEILDIDEGARRRGRLSAALYAVARTPECPEARQNPKAGGGDLIAEMDAALADYAGRMVPGTLYVLGPGTTMAALKARLGGGTLLGVDLARDGAIVARDLCERRLLAALENAAAARIVLTIVGGQGFLLGRGNQQISHRVIERVGAERIDVICAAPKLAALAPQELIVDTGDPALDARLAGYWPVLTGPGRKQVMRVVH